MIEILAFLLWVTNTSMTIKDPNNLHRPQNNAKPLENQPRSGIPAAHRTTNDVGEIHPLVSRWCAGCSPAESTWCGARTSASRRRWGASAGNTPTASHMSSRSVEEASWSCQAAATNKKEMTILCDFSRKSARNQRNWNPAKCFRSRIIYSILNVSAFRWKWPPQKGTVS